MSAGLRGGQGLFSLRVYGPVTYIIQAAPFAFRGYHSLQLCLPVWGDLAGQEAIRSGARALCGGVAGAVELDRHQIRDTSAVGDAILVFFHGQSLLFLSLYAGGEGNSLVGVFCLRGSGLSDPIGRVSAGGGAGRCFAMAIPAAADP